MTAHLYTGALEGDFDPETDTLHLKLQTVSPQRQWLNHIYNLFRRNQEMSLKPMYNPIVIEWKEAPKFFDIETPVRYVPLSQFEKNMRLMVKIHRAWYKKADDLAFSVWSGDSEEK